MNPIAASDISSTGTEIALDDGLTLRIRFERDGDMGPPWEEHDGHGSVSEWTTRDKRAGERVLHSDRDSKRYYDFADAIRIAKRDGWGLGDAQKAALAARLGRQPTAKQIRAEAVERDFEYLRAWCADEWQWTCIIVELLDASGREIACDSLGGVDGAGEYACGEAASMANALIAVQVEEGEERAHWEARDTVTKGAQ
jgi:hypothetical protein